LRAISITGGNTPGTAQDAITAERTNTFGEVIALSSRERWCGSAGATVMLIWRPVFS
jgi:hypothetical protein